MAVREESSRAIRLPRHARRAQLLVAAREVFVSHGYHAAAMDEIAVRAGVSKPVLYQHFPSKLDLYLALIDEGAAALINAVRQALASTRDNRERVTRAVEAYFAFVDDSAEAFRLLFESDLFNERAVRDRVLRTDDECAMLLTEVIAEDTGISSEEATLVAFGLIGMAQTTARRWLRTNGEIPREKAAWLVARMGWRGISGFPRTTESN